MSVITQTVEVPTQAPSERAWHICTGDHQDGECAPGCVSYCGRVYGGGGREPRGSDRVPCIDICVICQGLKDGAS